MKKNILNLIAILALSPLAMFANSGEINGENPTQKTYKAYWIATTISDQKIIVQEALVPEEALERNEQGEFAGVKMDLLDKALNYSALTSIQGAAVKYSQFVVEENNATNLQANMGASTTSLQTNDDRLNATLVCYGALVQGWTVVTNTCQNSYGKSNYCIAQKQVNGSVPGGYMIVYCK